MIIIYFLTSICSNTPTPEFFLNKVLFLVSLLRRFLSKQTDLWNQELCKWLCLCMSVHSVYFSQLSTGPGSYMICKKKDCFPLLSVYYPYPLAAVIKHNRGQEGLWTKHSIDFRVNNKLMSVHNDPCIDVFK